MRVTVFLEQNNKQVKETNDQEKRSTYSYDELKSKYIDKKPTTSFKTKEITSGLSIFVTFVINMVVLLTIGIFLGLYIDNKLNTKPLFLLLLILLGIGAAFRNMIKAITSNDDDQRST